MTTHEMRVRMLGNSEVFVTCSCMDRIRRSWIGRTTKSTRSRREAPAWKSLGDFPVSAPAEDLRAAHDAHLARML